jgi:hypothetical protein
MNVTTHALASAAAQREYLKEQLLVQFPELAEDEQALVDTLDGISDLDQMLVAVMRSTETDDMMVTGIKARIEELSERGKRLAHRIETKRDLVCRVMDHANIKKIESAEFTLSLRQSPDKVVITDEKLLPAAYLRTPEPPAPTPDKKAIADALKAKQDVPGAVLSNGGVSLSVRKK